MAQRKRQQPPEPTTVMRRKRDEQSMRRLTIWLPADVARELRVYCARNDTTMTAVVERLCRELLKMPED